MLGKFCIKLLCNEAIKKGFAEIFADWVSEVELVAGPTQLSSLLAARIPVVNCL